MGRTNSARLAPFAAATLRNESKAHKPQRATPAALVAGVLMASTPGAQARSAPAPIAQSGIESRSSESHRQDERERALRERMEPESDVRVDRPAPSDSQRLPADELPCFPIHAIRLEGDAAARFQWALRAANFSADSSADPATGRCLGTAGINVLMTRVQNAIVARGYVTTRVLAAPQDLKQGTLTLTVIPGRIRQIRFSEDASPRATQWNAVPAAPGDILNLRDIEQALENFKRLPTAEADIQITPADGPHTIPGESDLVIQWKQGMPFRLNLSADDSGSRQTGKYQGTATVSFDDWWTLNDLFYASVNHDLGGGEPGARGTHGYTVHYELPYGYWLFGGTVNGNDYFQTVAGASQAYRYSGSSRNGELRLSRVLYRDAFRKTGAYVRAWTRNANNFIDDVEIEVQRRRTAGWEVGLTHREFLGPAVLDASVAWRRGTGAMSAMRAPEEAFGEGSSRLELATADAQLSIPLTVAGQRARYGGTWRAQWNRTALTPQDRFSIGSRYTVRGFDGEMSLTGDRGWLLRNELGWTIARTGLELYVGADYGEVGGRSAKWLSGTRLAGAVIGLRGGHKGLYGDVFVGKPLYKPAGFRTASTTAGFSLNWSY